MVRANQVEESLGRKFYARMIALGIMNAGSAVGGIYLFALSGNISWLLAGVALSALAAYASD